MNDYMIVVNVPDRSLVWSNHAFVPKHIEYDKVVIKNFTLNATIHTDLAPNQVALNSIQRRYLKCSLGDDIEMDEWNGADIRAENLSLEVSPWKESVISMEHDLLCRKIRSKFLGQVLRNGQMVLTELNGATVYLQVKEGNGVLDEITSIQLHSDKIRLTGKSKFPNVDIQQLGIGGLNHEFEQLLRRAFASRTVAHESFCTLGIKHVKGILLYGPPGCGKTLIARRLGDMLGCDSPKLVNGPEVLNKYVGESEKNIRDLFTDAEIAQNNGESEIHVIIFDEIDAICRTRGSMQSSNGVNDSMVNQLLTKIDGVNALNNILVIGLTNRIDLIDAALLRPGRLEVQIEISLPNAEGRAEILQIHTRKMRENGLLENDVDFDKIVERSQNFTGAELEGLVKTATSHALTRTKNAGKLCLSMADFLLGLQEIRPSFVSCSIRDDWNLIDHSVEGLAHVHDIIDEARDNTICYTVLISEEADMHRRNEMRLTAEYMAHRYRPAFLKIIRATDIICPSEHNTTAHLSSSFLEAERISHGVVILEDLELLVQYCVTGPVFSNMISHSIKCFLRRCTTRSNAMLIIGTSSDPGAMKQLQMNAFFENSLRPLSLSQCLAVF